MEEKESSRTKVSVCDKSGKDCCGDGFEVSIGSIDYSFCCEDGFKETLDSFTKSLSERMGIMFN